MSLDASYSMFTFKLLEDTGWYKPIYEGLDEMSWGRGKGCDFLNSCDHTLYNEFAESQVEKCDFHSHAKGYGSFDQFSDTCNYI